MGNEPENQSTWKRTILRNINDPIEFTVAVEYKENPDTSDPSRTYIIRFARKGEYIEPILNDRYEDENGRRTHQAPTPTATRMSGIFAGFGEVYGGPAPFDVYSNFMKLLTQAIRQRQDEEAVSGYIAMSNEHGGLIIGYGPTSGFSDTD